MIRAEPVAEAAAKKAGANIFELQVAHGLAEQHLRHFLQSAVFREGCLDVPVAAFGHYPVGHSPGEVSAYLLESLDDDVLRFHKGDHVFCDHEAL